MATEAVQASTVLFTQIGMGTVRTWPLATWNCGFEGARGGMYEVDKRAFSQDVAQILEGAALYARLDRIEDHDVAHAVRRLCPSCSTKFDGYRAIAFKTGGKIHLRSRNDNDFSVRYSNVVKGLAKLPDETVIDGEVIALDDDGRPSFNILQNYGSSKAPVLYFVFDVMVLAGRVVMHEPLEARRELLEKKILPKLAGSAGGRGAPT